MASHYCSNPMRIILKYLFLCYKSRDWYFDAIYCETSYRRPLLNPPLSLFSLASASSHSSWENALKGEAVLSTNVYVQNFNLYPEQTSPLEFLLFFFMLVLPSLPRCWHSYAQRRGETPQLQKSSPCLQRFVRPFLILHYPPFLIFCFHQMNVLSRRYDIFLYSHNYSY